MAYQINGGRIMKNIDTKTLERIYDSIAMIVEDNKDLQEIEEPTIIDDLIEHLRLIHEELENRK